MKDDQLNSFTILMAEDDPDDRFFVAQAFQELGPYRDLRFVEDGQELMDYLRRLGKYADPMLSPRPMLILLDLNMPRKDGFQALLEIKTDPDLNLIPVAIWTTSADREDRIQTLKMGAEVYMIKPIDYEQIVNSINKLVVKYASLNGMTSQDSC